MRKFFMALVVFGFCLSFQKAACGEEVSLFSLQPTSGKEDCQGGYEIKNTTMYAEEVKALTPISYSNYGCRISYALGKKYSKFRAVLGVSDVKSSSKCYIGDDYIKINGEKIITDDYGNTSRSWINYGDKPVFYDIDISDAAILEMKFQSFNECSIGNPVLIPKGSSSDSSHPVYNENSSSTGSLEERVAALEAEVEALREMLEKIMKKLK